MKIPSVKKLGDELDQALTDIMATIRYHDKKMEQRVNKLEAEIAALKSRQKRKTRRQF